MCWTTLRLQHVNDIHDHNDDNTDDHDNYCWQLRAMHTNARSSSERSYCLKLCAVCSWLQVVALQHQPSNLHMHWKLRWRPE